MNPPTAFSFFRLLLLAAVALVGVTRGSLAPSTAACARPAGDSVLVSGSPCSAQQDRVLVVYGAHPTCPDGANDRCPTSWSGDSGLLVSTLSRTDSPRCARVPALGAASLTSHEIRGSLLAGDLPHIRHLRTTVLLI